MDQFPQHNAHGGHRCRTHVFHVKVSYREDHGGKTGRAFRLVDATVIDVNSAM